MDEQLLHKEEHDPECERPIAEPAKKGLFSKKNLLILSAILVAVVIVAVILFIPSHFESVEDEAVRIAGQISSRGENEFTIDTYPYEDSNMSSALISALAPDDQERALEAIRYVNEELGFGSDLYDRMLATNALMGLQREENDDYKVTWRYHPDEGLEVTYYNK